MTPLIQIEPGPIHLLIALVFDVLIIAMFVWMLLSWITMAMQIPPGNRFVRLIDAFVSPLTDPIRKRIPSMSAGMFNLSYTVAFIFAWWSLGILAFVILRALPSGW